MNTTSMKAIVLTKYGQAENLRLKEVAIPKPKADEVLVKVFASTVTTADAMMRKAEPFIVRFFMGFSKPRKDILGTGFAGKVVSVGEEVSTLKVGDEVFGESGLNFGANAEYVTVAADGVIMKKPDFLSYEEAATLSDGPLTSFNFLKNVGEIEIGQQVLINGASGSLGTAAIQIAKYYGATVTAVCSQKNFELVKSLGADEVIDYTTTDFTKNGKQYDIIYDTVGKLSFVNLRRSLTTNGKYLSPVLNGSILWAMVWISRFSSQKALFTATGLEDAVKLKNYLNKILDIMENDHLKVVIDKTLPLASAAEGHAYVDTGRKRGNVILKIA